MFFTMKRKNRQVGMQMNSMRAVRSHGKRMLAIATVLGALFCVAPVFGNPTVVLAQTTQRSVQGRVLNDNGAPVRRAIVYLSNVRTLTVQSYITESDGVYRFEQLSPNDDYKLWAAADGKKSKSRILSSFDNRPIFRVILKIDTAK